MEQIKNAIRHMISISEGEMHTLLEGCYLKTFARKSDLSVPHKVSHDVFFINKGIVRVYITDREGNEHTVHFALENQFIAEYSSFLQKVPSHYGLQALEPTEAIVMPREVIEWGYKNLKEGDRLGRYIAEYYFVYLDNRIKNLYTKSPSERYASITQVFPDIHKRVPQHMIATYLGVTPVHLSRLKKASIKL